jgi:FkbM family methyltransferase
MRLPPAPHPDELRMLTPEQVAWGYRYLLGREPESDKIIALQARNHTDWRSFRHSLLASAEFKGGQTSLNLPSKWVAADVFGGKRMIWLDLRDDFVSREALRDSYETIESAFVSALLRPGDVFLDIGANIGWFTLLASTLIGESGHIHAFEPLRPTVGYLRRSVAVNGLQPMVTVHEFGLADVEGEFRLAWKKNSRNPGNSYLVDGERDGIETISIQLRTLDSLRLDKVDFVKLDVEGAEPKVFAGGRNTFKKHRPIVMSELFPDQLKMVAGISPREFIAMFKSLDYQSFIVDQHESSEAVDDFPGDFPREVTNIGLIPSEKLESAAAMLVAAGIDRPIWSQRTGPNAVAISSKHVNLHTGGGTVTREQIRDAYICVLGREPESEQAYQAHTQVTSITDLRYILMLSLEYRSLFRSVLQAQERDTLVFIHMEKTGGTTLHNVLAANFAPEKVAPLEEGVLRSFSAFESVKYDFFSAHCDYEIALAIPRRAKKFVALFRKPTERLVSFYRFFRSHPLNGDLGQNDPHRLANTLSPEDFFSHSAIRSWAKVNNNYLRVFGSSLERPIIQTDERAALKLATERIKHLDAIGLTHRMDESVAVICKSLGFPIPERFESAQKTDELPTLHPQLKKVAPVDMTERLAKALEELTYYDEIIYQTAVDEFERRLLAGGKSERPAAGSWKPPRRSKR